MEINRCFGCMEEITAYPCPRCGYTPEMETTGYILRPGTILCGKYLMGKVLGQGGFGITYIAWDLTLKRKVAVKEYYPSGQVSRHPGTGSILTWYKTDQAAQARQAGMEMFLKEARKMSLVDNVPGVVRVRELFQENETAYIVMDFVEGQTLKARLREKGPMSWEEAKDVFLPAIQTMEQVHRAGLVHRDLSPDNLMLTTDGKVQILDLGAAKDLNINSGASSMQVAKKGFSPLEQYGQRGGSGPWTDVYAMAATIYYTLTGVLPPAAVDRLEGDALDWAHPRLRALPDHVLDALKNAMAVLSKDRTQSMAELERALFTAPQAQPAPTPKKFPVKKWLLPAIAAVAAVLGAALWLTRPTNTVKAAREAAGPPDWRNNVLRRFSGDITDPMGFGDIDRERVRSVTFLDTLADAPSNSVDISDSQDGSVWMWSEASGSLLDLYIAGNGGVNGEVACKYLFYECTNLQSVDFGQSFHVETATNMSCMFDNCPALTSLDGADWDTSSVTNMRSMFGGCDALTALDLSGWDTSSVTDMASMFFSCDSLTDLDLSGWDTSSVTDMSYMFSSCDSLTDLDLSGLDTSAVTDMSSMFSGCTSMTGLDLSGLDTSSVTDMNSMFSSCLSLANLNLSGWDTSSVTDMGSMFNNCPALAHLDAADWNTSSVTDMGWMFTGCEALSALDLTGWTTSSAVDMSYMFSGCEALTALDLTGWTTSSAVDMSYMFSGCEALTALDLTGWDTSSVTDMQSMFSQCGSLTTLDLSGWDTSSVTDMRNMFSLCTSLTALDLTGWDTSSVTDMDSMFSNCSVLTNLDVAGWDTSSVTNMRSLFNGCGALTALDLAGWDTSSVTDMSSMFHNCSALTNLDIAGWDTSSVTDMHSMFQNCSALTNLDVAGWDTSSVTDMNYMFSGCRALAALDPSRWNTSSVTNMGYMFDTCKSLAALDLSGWNTSSVMYMTCMFNNCRALTDLDLSGWDVSAVTDYTDFMVSDATINGRPWEEFFR